MENPFEGLRPPWQSRALCAKPFFDELGAGNC